MKKFLVIAWKAVKEPLREIVLAAIPGVLVYLETIQAEWAIVLYLILRAIDSYLHELGKAKKSSALISGITRF